MRCYKCNKLGHIRKFYPGVTHKKKEDNKDSDQGDASVASDGYDSANIFVASNTSLSEEWVLDLGWSFHMCPKKLWMQDIVEADSGMVLLRNNKT